ncbi:hypothetical protein BU26DRAFT_559736 [Trematosphaeria pertusa]|uniref:RING-type domain-containing protein n=1 Tax=Trematosphaeria pertusa TaxID=390896 RepID=A0A6A6IX31_9PLEO|nr:uncharacterized protein BU26DRAFT_559736 [Trematosphaeria pertusa]KAF2255115.1 hypothetical protein BU26DRAFT_559736 [Trematosphaeria pertusa]
MTTAVRSQDLNLETAVEACGTCHENVTCSICTEPCNDPSPKCVSAGSNRPTVGEEVVKTAVCSHYFHRKCLMAWLTSASPTLNTCPNCRGVLFGSTAVSQRVHNLLSADGDIAQTRAEVEAQFRSRWDRNPPAPPFAMLTDYDEDPGVMLIQGSNDDILVWISRR